MADKTVSDNHTTKAPPRDTKAPPRDTKALPKDIQKLSFEAALEDLENIVRDLEAGSGELEGAIKAFERGTMLKRHCEAMLKAAEARIDKILPGHDGAVEGVEASEFE